MSFKKKENPLCLSSRLAKHEVCHEALSWIRPELWALAPAVPYVMGLGSALKVLDGNRPWSWQISPGTFFMGTCTGEF